MSYIADIVQGQHGIPVLIVVSVFLLIAIYQSKRGLWSFSAKGLTIGVQERTTTIIRDQWTLIDSTVEGFVSTLLYAHPECHEESVKYIGAKCADILQKAVILNAMSTDDSYISLEQSLVYNAILKRTRSALVYTQEFKSQLYSTVQELIVALVHIKQQREER